MQKFYAATIVTVISDVNNLWMHLDEPDARERVVRAFEALQGEAERYGWKHISNQIGRFLRRVKAEEGITARFDSISTVIIDLLGSVQYQLTQDLFICIQGVKIDYMSRPHDLIGQDILSAFPSASYDLLESARCFALDRWTAAVFHLMRALEPPLASLGGVFGVSLAHTNWGPAIEQIESRIRTMHTQAAWKALPNCKSKQEEYSQMASHFGVLKDAWRNYTAHGRGKYGEAEATEIFMSVRAFIKKVTTCGLREKP